MNEVCENLYPSVFGNAEFFTRSWLSQYSRCPKAEKVGQSFNEDLVAGVCCPKLLRNFFCSAQELPVSDDQ